MLEDGGRALDAVVDGVAIIENDPQDHTVGLGGIPNERGVVQLDASVMDGKSMRAGGVGALENIQNPAQVAKLVLEKTTRVLLVGEGALEFARAHGFQETNLLTERARKAWLLWKRKLNDRDDWMFDPKDLEDPDMKWFYESYRKGFWPHGTVHISALGKDGDIAGCTSTSGLFFKLPGRVGDSPIIGAGLYVDGDVGSAGSTGWGEGNLQSLGAHNVVENMRRGDSPEEACLGACRRIVESLLKQRVEEKDAAARWNVSFYAINLDGEVGGASIWSGGTFAVHDGGKSEPQPLQYLFERS